MAYSVQMPELGESVTEGTVTRWLKSEGDTVEVDEPLLEVSTDKVDTEIPSPAAGTVQRIVAQQDETIEVGAELAVLDDGSGDSGASAGSGGGAAQQEQQQQPPQQQEQEPQQQEQQQAAPAPSGGGGAAEGTPVEMPALGESVTEGTITRWLKSEGDTVEVDEPLLEVSTDKVDTEIPSPVAGTLQSILAHEDDTVEVGGRLAMVGGGSGSQQGGQAQAQAPQQQEAPAQQESAQQAAPAQQAPAQQPAQSSAPRHAAEQPQQAPQPQQQPAPAPTAGSTDGAAQATGTESAPYVTPLVRKLANENGVDLSTLTGSGVGGRIRKQDVQAAIDAKQAPAQQAPAQQAPAPAAQQPSAAPAPSQGPSPELAALRGTVQKAGRIRQVIAKRTRESLQSSAQLTQIHEVDVTRVAKLRQRAKNAFAEREGVKLTFLPFFVKATVEALKQHPNVNAYFDEDAKEITYYGEEHLAVAVDTDRGLLSPVIHDAGQLNLAGLAHKIDDLASRTRANTVKPDELSGGTFTVTNLGSNGALFDTPIINQPQSGILGIGAVVKRPVVVSDEQGDDSIAVRSMAYLSLTYDHRQIDGADAGRFLTTIKRRLEEGSFESDLGL